MFRAVADATQDSMWPAETTTRTVLVGLAETFREMAVGVDAFGQLVRNEAESGGQMSPCDVETLREALEGLREARARSEDLLTTAADPVLLELHAAALSTVKRLLSEMDLNAYIRRHDQMLQAPRRRLPRAIAKAPEHPPIGSGKPGAAAETSPSPTLRSLRSRGSHERGVSAGPLERRSTLKPAMSPLAGEGRRRRLAESGAIGSGESTHVQEAPTSGDGLDGRAPRDSSAEFAVNAAQPHVSQITHGWPADVPLEALLKSSDAYMHRSSQRGARPGFVCSIVDQVDGASNARARARPCSNRDLLAVAVRLTEQQAVQQKRLHVSTGALVGEEPRPVIEFTCDQLQGVDPGTTHRPSKVHCEVKPQGSYDRPTEQLLESCLQARRGTMRHICEHSSLQCR